MIVVDTSAFISLTITDVLNQVLTEYEVHTTQQVIDEPDATAEYDDVHDTAANQVITRTQDITVHAIDDPRAQTSRIDEGEGSDRAESVG